MYSLAWSDRGDDVVVKGAQFVVAVAVVVAGEDLYYEVLCRST